MNVVVGSSVILDRIIIDVTVDIIVLRQNKKVHQNLHVDTLRNDVRVRDEVV